MLTPDERRAALFLAALTVAGALVRQLRTAPGPAGSAIVAPHLPGQDIVRQAARSRRAEALKQPLGPGETVDADRASAEELERLPGVGPALARRIVEDRERSGPYGSLAELDRVPGIGPAMLRTLEPWVIFSAPLRPASPQASRIRPRSSAAP